MKPKYTSNIATSSAALSFILTVSALCGISQAATVNAFWSVQNDKAGTGGANGALTATTFGGTAPSISRTGSTLNTNGGATSFVSYEGGSPWLGSGGTGNPGNSFSWEPGSNSNSISIALDMTNTFDLTLRTDIRSAEGSGGTRSTAFTAIEYQVGGGAFISTGSSLSYGLLANNNFQAYNLDLSALSAIENQPNVVIRFSVPDQGGGATPASFRMDNIQLTADLIPEPSTALLLGFSALGLLIRRR